MKQLLVLITFTQMILASVEFTNIPELATILDACTELSKSDILEDSFTAPENAIYVSVTGDDEADGTIGSPLATLDEAIKQANSTTEPLSIFLREGVHSYLSKGKYQEIERGNLWIGAYENEQVTIRPIFFPNQPADWGEAHCFVFTGPFENITFDNLDFEGWNSIFYMGSAYDEEPLRNIVIKNSVASQFIDRFKGEGSGTFFTCGYLQDNIYGDSKVIFNTPEDAKYQIEGITIKNVSVSDLSVPINVGDENDANIKGFRISNFSVINPPANSGNSASDAIAIVNSYKVLLDHIQIENIADDGIDCKSYNVSIVNSIVVGTGRNAIKFWRGGEIINSVIYNCTQINDASLVGGSEGSLRFVNSILAEKQIGYSGGWNDTEDGKLEMINSVFIDLKKSFFVRSFDNFTARNNCYYNVPEALYTGEINVTNVAELNDLTNGVSNIDMDPLFNNLSGGDYHLMENSPLINSGTNVSVKLPSFDLFGNSRIQGSAIDIGPVESSESTAITTFANTSNSSLSNSVIYTQSTHGIRFTVPQSVRSESLEIFSSRGQRIANIGGSELRQWSGLDMPEGIYLYRIGSFAGKVQLLH